jgi:hypothetical protein
MLSAQVTVPLTYELYCIQSFSFYFRLIKSTDLWFLMKFDEFERLIIKIALVQIPTPLLVSCLTLGKLLNLLPLMSCL